MSAIFTRRAMAALLALPALFVARKTNAHTALLSVLGDRRAASMVGRMALAAVPGLGDADAIAGGIWNRLGMEPASDAAAIRARLSALIREDFAAERTVRLDGWLLSETEARLCALATLTA